MHGSVSPRPRPPMSSRLWVLAVSCSCLLSMPTVPAELVFSVQPEDAVAVLGAPLTLHCAVHDLQQQRALSVRWERDRGPATATHPGPVAEADPLRLTDGSLFFPHLREEHLGRYVCSAGAGAESVRAAATVERAALDGVFFSPKARTVHEGEGVFLQCVSGDSSPPAHISWIKDGKLLQNGKQIEGQYGGGNQKKTSGTLRLTNVTLEDDGTYVCVARNALLNISRKSAPTKLTVLGTPRRVRISRGPVNTTVAMGTEASMRCAAHGFPVPMVHWFKDGCPLTNCSTSLSLQDNGQLLVFRNVSAGDEGSYHCEASNQRETVCSPPAFLHLAVMAWSFVLQPTDQTVRTGRSATLVCRPPRSRPPAHVSWFKDNRLLSPEASLNATVLPSGDLFFRGVQPSDSGTYFCRASNALLHRSVTSRRVTLTVLAHPSVRIWPQVVTVPVGAPVVLGCEVWGHPLPSIRWYKGGRRTETGGKITVGQRSATLRFLSVMPYDEGTYMCEAANALGRNHSTATLRVAVSPVMVSFAGQLSGQVGAPLVLPCRAVGILPITYTWTRGKADVQIPISSTQDTRADDDGSLLISAVRWADAGEYRCTAENRAGRQQQHLVLLVTGPERPDGGGKPTRRTLSAVTNAEALLVRCNHSALERRSGITHNPPVGTGHRETASPATQRTPAAHPPTLAFASLKYVFYGQNLPPGSPEYHSQRLLTEPTAQAVVSQTQPEVLRPSPPYQNAVSLDAHGHLPATSKPFSQSYTESPINPRRTPELDPQLRIPGVPYPLPQNQSHPVTQLLRRAGETSTQPDAPGASDYYPTPQAQIVFGASRASMPGTQKALPHLHTQLSPALPLGSSRRIPDVFSQRYTPVARVDPRHSGSTPSSWDLHSTREQSQIPPRQMQPFTESLHSQSQRPPSATTVSKAVLRLTQESRRNLEQTSLALHALSQPTSAPSPQPLTQTYVQPSQIQPSPTQQHTPPMAPHHTQPSQTRPQSFQIPSRPPPPQPPPPFTISPPPKRPRTLPHYPQSSMSTTHLPENPPTAYPNTSGTAPVNASVDVHSNTSRVAVPGRFANDTERTDELKRNTSQSPMTSDDPRVTQQSPSWLPVLEKHDIPIVVGVGVSLAFIFITMAFYSLVQKNEPVPTSRAAQRNLGVPIRHAERRTTGKTYDNRAFEDDDCVAGIEQSPNTSDTRARPPGPGLVMMVQMEPTSEDLQENTQPSSEDHLVSVETYPEPVLDTQVDSSAEEKSCSPSQPSVLLQCLEDWTSNGGDSRDVCQDTLPPPSPLPSRLPSPSPSPPTVREEGLHSSLTLRTSETSTAPVHHSLSISHASSPLLFSHHVSVGPTTVAVDVHFYPTGTAAMAIATNTHISSVSNVSSGPPCGSPMANSHENAQSASGTHQNK